MVAAKDYATSRKCPDWLEEHIEKYRVRVLQAMDQNYWGDVGAVVNFQNGVAKTCSLPMTPTQLIESK